MSLVNVYFKFFDHLLVNKVLYSIGADRGPPVRDPNASPGPHTATRRRHRTVINN